MTFGPDNLPYGSVLDGAGRRRAVVRLGDAAFDLAALDSGLFADGTLDAFLAAGHEIWGQVRAAARAAVEADVDALLPLAGLTPVLAFTVADYVDFYASEDHASNAGRIFRPTAPEPLTANWRHVPVGYYGRSASVVVGGTPVRRPRGVLGPGAFGPSERLDFEAEVGFVVGTGGRELGVDDADEHVFGLCLLNDWSARDVQGFETVPLGPFLGKSFATSVSPWITPLAALDAVRRPHPPQDPVPTSHLRDDGHALDLRLEVAVNGYVVSRPEFAGMYWTYAQMLAHLTSNGAAARTGDLFGSGTVSGPDRGRRGCLLELTWNGTEPLEVGGRAMSWLADGDEVTITARAGELSLGAVSGRVLPA